MDSQIEGKRKVTVDVCSIHLCGIGVFTGFLLSWVSIGINTSLIFGPVYVQWKGGVVLGKYIPLFLVVRSHVVLPSITLPRFSHLTIR